MDPNSLQGRILTMLDDDGLMGDFPTRAELAPRLEQSQQLTPIIFEPWSATAWWRRKRWASPP
ncbi:MAG: hypothetical protein CM15mP128_2240 [Methanobacteriota archaeon]|nr:MAG: hypothetical protein CM15mP128_2240 [Euryarchaeota archaeon]